MDSAIFLQARLDSTRLPNKIIKPIGGKTLIEQVIDRLKLALSDTIKEIIVVTSYNSITQLQSIIKDQTNISFLAGPEDNVLKRFYLANQRFKYNTIIRATADNPFVSVDHIHSILKQHYIHNADLSHYLNLPLGSGVEIINATALDQAYHYANQFYQQEHVTPYIYENQNIFRVEELLVATPFSRPEIRLTIDEINDFNMANHIFQKLGYQNNFSLTQIIELWEKDSLQQINGMVKQKILI